MTRPPRLTFEQRSRTRIASWHRRLARCVLRLRRDQSGSMVPLMAMTLVAGVGLSTLVLDVGMIDAERSRLQAAADAAAMAAAVELPDEAAAKAAALEIAQANLDAADADLLTVSDVTIGVWDADQGQLVGGGSKPDAVEVRLRRDRDRGKAFGTAFAGILGFDDVEMAQAATAYRSYRAPCFLALAASRGVDVNNGTLEGIDCGFQVNATDEPTNGSSNGAIISDRTCQVGAEVDADPTYTPHPETGCSVYPDPFADLAPALPSACNQTNATISNTVMTPGVYCGDTTLTGNVTLQPGTYYFNGQASPTSGSASKRVRMVGSATLTGESVTLVGYNGVEFDFSGGGAISLKGAQSGDFEGFVFFVPSSNTYTAEHSFKGGIDGYYEGSIYFPRHTVWITGNSTLVTTSPYVIVVVNDLQFSGTGTFTIDSRYGDSAVPLPDRFAKGAVALVD